MDETPGGVRARGAVAEVWQGGKQVGTLWDWRIEGHARQWAGWAERQSFTGSFRGGDVEVRFFVTAASEHLFQLRAEGQVTEYVAGEKIRHLCRMQGSRMWLIAVQLSA